MAIQNISNRAELRIVLEKSLNVPDDELADDEELLIDKKPKSYIIESNLVYPSFSEESPLKTSIKNTDDSTLKIITLSSQDDISSFYLDISDNRFWIIHSLSSSLISSKLIGKLVTFNPSRLDYPWFSSKHLEDVGKLGKETGFSLRFDNKFLNKKDDSYEDKLQKISMRFWGGESNNVITNLRKDDNITQGVSLSSLGLNYRTETGKIKANISSLGKIVAMKGDSIDSYFNLITRIKENYKQYLLLLEEKYRISIEKKDQGFKLSGGYTIIDFKKQITDLDEFCNILTSCSSPFRIWGVWTKIDDDYIKINGIDLHTNDKVNIELTPDWMRIFLPKDSCGNVVARLFSNLQNHFDSQISLRGSDNEKIIK